MSLTAKFILFQTVILIPFFTGYRLRDRLAKRDVIARNLIRFNLLCVDALIVFWTVWELDIGIHLLTLPIAGLLLAFLGLGLGFILVPALKLDREGRRTFLISASLANHGFTLGGFLCYLLLGETGLGLSFIFISYFIPYVFLFIFPFAGTASNKETSLKPIEYILNLRNMPLYSLFIAVILASLGIERPAINFPIDLLLMISIAGYYGSLGLTSSLRDFGWLKRANLILSSIKFILIPVITFLILLLFDLPDTIRAVIIIQSCMPAAIYSVVTAILFELDVRLASGLFVFNTITFLIIVLPVLFLLKDYLLKI
jgi:predicted permease